MKKVSIFYCLFLYLVLLIIPGCGKDPIEPITPVEELSLRVQAMPNILDSPGLKAVIEITAVADSTVSDLPGATFISGSFTKTVETPKLGQTTTFRFRSYLDGEVAYNNVTIHVLGVPSPPNPTLTLTSSVSILPIGGGEVTITIITTSADSVFSFFDGKKLLPNCNETYIIDTTTTFTYEAYGPGGKIKKDTIVVVEEPLTIAQLLFLASLKIVKLEFKLVDGDWYEGDIGCRSDDKLTFYIEPQTVTEDYGEIKCGGSTQDSASFPWVLDGYFISIGDPRGIIREITFISNDTLVWIYCFSDGVCTRETFVHP
jgi:hypothetical protein